MTFKTDESIASMPEVGALYFFRSLQALFHYSEELLPLPQFCYFFKFSSALLLVCFSTSAILYVVCYCKNANLPVVRYSATAILPIVHYPAPKKYACIMPQYTFLSTFNTCIILCCNVFMM